MRLLLLAGLVAAIIVGIVVIRIIARPDDPHKPSYLDGLGGYDEESW